MSSREQTELCLDEHIVCPICHDFLSDAVTLTNCLHFFCRKCLDKCLNSSLTTSSSNKGPRCPKCSIELGPEPYYRRDQKMQEMVYKLVPDLFWRQLRKIARRRQRHRSSGESTTSERRIQQQRQLVQLSSELCSPNEKISLQLDYIPLNAVLAANDGGGVDVPRMSRDSIAKAQLRAKHNFRRFFRCPAKARVKHLKKLLETKLSFEGATHFIGAQFEQYYGVYFVDLELRNVLEDEYSLEELIQMFKWSREGPFKICFTLARISQEGEDRPPVLEEMPQLDVESGPMEQIEPIELGQLLKKLQQQEEEANETGKKDEATSRSSPPPPSLTVQRMPSSSPPANASAVPRLSQAGVSPLRPVPSLVGNIGPSTSQQQPPAAKKRKRNSSSTATEKGKVEQNQGQPSEKAQKSKKQKTETLEMAKEAQSQLQQVSGQASSIAEAQNHEPKAGEGGEQKEMQAPEKVQVPPSQQQQQCTSSQPLVQNVPSDSADALPPPPPLSPTLSPPVARPRTPPPLKPKKPRPPRKQQQQAASKQTPNSHQQQQKQPEPSFPGIPPPAAPPSIGGTPCPSSLLLPGPHQFALPVMAPQNQQQYALLIQNLLQNRQANEALGALATMFQGMSQQQMQAFVGMAAMAAQGQQHQQPKMMTPIQPRPPKATQNRSSGTAKQQNGTGRQSGGELGGLQPPTNGANQTTNAKSAVTKKTTPTGSQQQLNPTQLASSSGTTIPIPSNQRMKSSSPRRLMSPPTMVPTHGQIAAVFKATMPG